jgi:hypothetical protein
MILLKDGIKYLPYEYADEKELTTMIVEHHGEIFGINTLYFDPQTMKTYAGVEARNDGVILAPSQNKWYILEVELAEHSIHKHIIPQVTKFHIAYKRPETRKRITDTLFNQIKGAPDKMMLLQTLKIEDTHKYLSDIIDSKPTIAIVIDQETPDLDDVCTSLPFPTRALGFRTFTRENIGLGVHIHQFEPIIGPPPEAPKSLLKVLAVSRLVQEGKPYVKAFKIVSEQFKVGEPTIRGACTRALGLNTKQFLKLLQNKPRIIALLKERYPDYKSLIDEKLA